MKETDNPQQRAGWVLRLNIDATGVHAFDTHVARINHQGVPSYDKQAPSPCWQRPWGQERQCVAGSRSDK
jgi:poly-gamma-glutamate synthesis protein (capsule biosynthesis protein)